MRIVETLTEQAKEISDAGLSGWGNTMLAAVDKIEALNLIWKMLLKWPSNVAQPNGAV